MKPVKRKHYIMSVIKAIVFNKRTPFTRIKKRVERLYGKYLERKQCPICGKRFRSNHRLLSHLYRSPCGMILAVIYEGIYGSGEIGTQIWDYKRGEIVDKISGEVVERIYV